MKIYTTYADEEHWVCQWKHDCILFALINSGAFGPIYFSWLEWNENMKEKTLEENILFELKVITLWSFITGHYPYRHREIFYTIYSAFMRLTKNREKMDESVYRKKILFYEKKLGELFDLFSNLDGESLNDGSLDERKRVKLKTEDFTSLEDLPYKSLICIENKRWVVYLKADGDNAIVLDSKICDGHSRIPVSALKGQKIIKPENIEFNVDFTMADFTPDDFDNNPEYMLHNFRRDEFSKKIAECICKVDQISFTEHDYNRLVRQAKSALEKLDKEHYRYTSL